MSLKLCLRNIPLCCGGLYQLLVCGGPGAAHAELPGLPDRVAAKAKFRPGQTKTFAHNLRKRHVGVGIDGD